MSINDRVLDKPNALYMTLAGYCWSKRIYFITLFYTDAHGQHQPDNFRIDDTAVNKKNDYIFDWALEPSFVTVDRRYGCVENLKTIVMGKLSNTNIGLSRYTILKAFKCRETSLLKKQNFAAIYGLRYLRDMQ